MTDATTHTSAESAALDEQPELPAEQHPAEELSDRLGIRERTVLVLLLIATFVVFLNETTMSVAIPRIMDDLGVTPSTGQWLTTAFALTMAVVIPITGWLLERVPTRPIYVSAMILFTAGTLLAALAPVFELLIVARVIQACGTAIMMPLMMTTVLTIVPPSQRGRIMGRISIVMSVAPAIGPAVSGLILDFGGWRGIFWVMLPLAIVALVLGILLVPNVSVLKKVPLDALSVLLSAFAFSLLVYGLSSFGTSAEGGGAVPAWIPAAAGAVLLALFVWRQISLQRRDAALLDLRTFRTPVFTVASIMFAVSTVALFGLIIVFPLFMVRGLGLDELTAGLILLPGGLAMGLLGPVIGRLYDRFGPRPLVVPGSIIAAAVFWLLAFATETTPLPALVIGHIALSIGLSMVFTPLFAAGLGSLPRDLYSHGSAIVTTLQQVAGAAGAALFAALYSIGVLAAGAADPITATPVEVAAGVRLAFLVGAIVILGSVVASFFVRKPEAEEGAEASGFAGH